jgi:cysteine sulfinate desulfinase/cysteine desulfurase-like protein
MATPTAPTPSISAVSLGRLIAPPIGVKLPIFLDNHSTTPVDPRVLETMLPFFTEHFGNAASRNHVFGWTAEAAVDVARGQIAALIGGDAKEIVITSGATEAINLAIKGVASYYGKTNKHIITVDTEHKATLDTCKRLEREGFTVTYLAPATDGLVTPEQVAAAVTDQTILVSIMLANNEIGVVQPMADIARAVKAKNPKTLIHSDVVQAAGKVEVDVHAMQRRCGRCTRTASTSSRSNGPGISCEGFSKKPSPFRLRRKGHPSQNVRIARGRWTIWAAVVARGHRRSAAVCCVEVEGFSKKPSPSIRWGPLP